MSGLEGATKLLLDGDRIIGYENASGEMTICIPDCGRVKPNNQRKPGPIGNTQGIVVPQTSPNLSGSTSAPTPTAPPGQEDKGWWGRWGSAATHGLLDVIGLVPVFGEAANAIGGVLYLAEGDPASAALDFAAMWPAGGQAATVAKYGKKAGGAVLEQVAKKSDDVAEIAAKQSDEAAQAAGKKADDAASPKKKDDGGNVKGNCKHLEKGPPGATHKGGKHGKVQEDSARGVRESHHIPPKSISPHGEANGPAISMDYADHRGLSSTGRSRAHPASIAQEKLAKSGPAGFLAAMMVEIAEIRKKHPGKYEPAIAWMLLWAACMGYIPAPGGKK